LVGGSLDRNSAAVRETSIVREMSINDVGNGQVPSAMFLANTVASRLETSIDDGVKRMEEMMATALVAQKKQALEAQKRQFEEHILPYQQMFADSLEAQKRLLETHVSPYHRQMQYLMENAVSVSLKATTFSKETQEEVSQTRLAVKEMHHMIRGLQAEVALALGIEASTPSR
jgi:nucleotidyltransferase/DNA polymerase involved in DNA repair